MADATLRQIHERIIEIDDLTFRGSTGQITMTLEGRGRLEDEARALMEILANALHDCGSGEYRDLYDARQKVRDQTLLSATMDRYVELHPETQPEIDALLTANIKGYSDGTMPPGEPEEVIGAVFGTVFVDLPSEVSLPPPPAKRSLLRRILRQ